MPRRTEPQGAKTRMPFHRRVVDDLFLRHPAAAGETYLQHLLFTIRTGGYLLVTSAAMIFHGLVPRFCQTTASDRIIRLGGLMKERRGGRGT